MIFCGLNHPLPLNLPTHTHTRTHYVILFPDGFTLEKMRMARLISKRLVGLNVSMLHLFTHFQHISDRGKIKTRLEMWVVTHAKVFLGGYWQSYAYIYICFSVCLLYCIVHQVKVTPDMNDFSNNVFY